ncbi:MAG: glycosyltransferase family protein [Rhodospirillaceae bacterium]
MIFVLAPRAVYRPVMVSPKELVCGPDIQDSDHPDGRPATRRCPQGLFDAAAFLRQVAPDFAADLVMVKADGSRRLLPSNLAAVAPRRVLMVGDTHHYRTPLQVMLEYAAQEPIDCIFTDHDRHHLHYFHEAGFPSVHWLPLFNVNLYPDLHGPDPKAPRSQEVAVIGALGAIHARRRHLIHQLRGAGLAVRAGSMPQKEAAEVQAHAALAVNQSLNGDLNLRCGEVMAHGGLLASDRLAPESGLHLLFEENKHLVCYETAAELVATAEFLINHPGPAASLAQAGAARARFLFDPVRMGQILFQLVETGTQDIEPLYHMRHDQRWVPGRSLAFQARMAVFEVLQQVHQRCGRLWVRLPDGAQSDLLAEDLQDLPRLRIVDPVDPPEPEPRTGSCQAQQRFVAVLDPQREGSGEDGLADVLAVQRWDAVVLYVPDESADARYAQRNRIGHLLAMAGYGPDTADPRLYRLKDPIARIRWLVSQDPGWLEMIALQDLAIGLDPACAVALAEMLDQAGLSDLALSALLAAVKQDRAQAEALQGLAEALGAEDPQGVLFMEDLARASNLSDPNGSGSEFDDWRWSLPPDLSALRVLIPMPDPDDPALLVMLEAIRMLFDQGQAVSATFWLPEGTDLGALHQRLMERDMLSMIDMACLGWRGGTALSARHNVLLMASPSLFGGGSVADLAPLCAQARLAPLPCAALEWPDWPAPLAWQAGDAFGLASRLEQLLEHTDLWRGLCQQSR